LEKAKTDQRRDPHADNDLIDDDLPVPAQGGSSGGDLQRETGSIDEEKTATGADPQPTSVHKGQKPRDGDEPNLPNRDGDGQANRAPPRRT
jgi:hypothetical protein